ncbi:MAG: hypothetical protein H0U17_09870 [Actinobacteria bacterium]|jgi:hypothetical protein|nr:hypothetical protein [Actinomycetota bacterium]
MALFLGSKSKQTVTVPEIEDRELVQILSFIRLAIGAGFLLFPRRLGRMWTGEEGTSTTSAMALRSLGGRDAAIAIGTMVALENDGNVRGWLEAGALSDASDAVSTLSNWGDLPPLRRLLGLASSLGAVAIGLNLAQALDD